MIQTLNQFTTNSLFEASSLFLNKLGITHNGYATKEALKLQYYFEEKMPQYLQEAIDTIAYLYDLGCVNDSSLGGTSLTESPRYEQMNIFAFDAKPQANITRTIVSSLTRAFNRIADDPVILIIRQGNYITLSTCDRKKGAKDEVMGKVTMLRNINCTNPHRGHIDILESLGKKTCNTFEELYKHWMEVFSNELLTKKFYNDLSDWYAWAVMVAKFPNDISTTDDDAKFNHESVIRLITRLIFVWFLKEKHLIPKEFFDEKYIRETLIDEFDPHDKQSLYYNAGESKYYRLILQNLFFAMLNCPIVAEGKTTPNNRRFRGDGQKGYVRDGYNINNLMRYEKEFKEGGTTAFMNLANSSVPFLNGGLFDCLDDKPRGLYYDGFSERKESLEQLFLPDYLFFGEEVGNGIDLSQWYGDRSKKNVSARGLIDILKRYSFTIEENTPLDQEVSLDPELLGKVFENLLASFNPETKTSARKQTGSFYTPREIVQYMVDESLVAHLKRMCGDEMEPQYRQLLKYATDEVALTDVQCKSIMNAIYNCRVLDPACGSGAFPMGVLQQMVHVLKRIDPTNKMWKELMIDRATAQSKIAFGKNDEEERKARLDDIKNAFDQSINYPDYARKLYLIENCIYGVDIQPIATQISKLRFFISLVVDQKPTNDAKSNFGIRPLPNLEAKFVTANTLIPLDRSHDLFSSCEDIQLYEEQLRDINHRIFLAKKNSVKKQLQRDMYATRATMAQVMQNNGFIGNKGHNQLTSWDMFNQNSSAPFFDPEWMFGVKGGFDIVIGNPPYVQIKKLSIKDKYKAVGYKSYDSTGDLYCLFYEFATNQLSKNGVAAYITSNKWLKSNYGKSLRSFLVKESSPTYILDLGPGVFENAAVDTNIIIWRKTHYENSTCVAILRDTTHIINVKWEHMELKDNEMWTIDSLQYLPIKFKIEKIVNTLGTLGYELDYGILTGANKTFILNEEQANKLRMLDSKNSEIIKPILRGQDLGRYCATFNNIYLLCSHNGVKKDNVPPINIENDYPTLIPYFESFGDDFKNRGEQGNKFYNLRNCAYILKYENPKIIYADIVQDKGKFYYDEKKYYTNDTAFLITGPNLKYIVGILNSTAFSFFYKNFYCGSSLGKAGLRFKRDFLLRVPIPIGSQEETAYIENNVEYIYSITEFNPDDEIIIHEKNIDHIVYHLYDLTYDEVLIIDPETPITREEYESYKAE